MRHANEHAEGVSALQRRRHFCRFLLNKAALAIAGVLLAAGCDAVPQRDPATEPLPLTPPAADGEELAETPPNPDGLQLAPGFAPLPFGLSGTGWLVTAVDGVPTADLQDDLATVHFGRSYLRWMGCDQMQALYVPLTRSFAVGQVEHGTSICGGNTVDEALASVLSEQPLIGRNREGKIMLAGRDHTVTLSQIDSGPSDPKAPPLDTAPFEIMSSGAPESRPILSLHDGGFAVWMDCPAAISGSLRLVENRLRTANVQVKECETFRSAAREELADFFRASPAIARGRSGELLLSNGETVIAARQCSAQSAKCRRTAAAIHAAEEEAAADDGEASVDIPAG